MVAEDAKKKNEPDKAQSATEFASPVIWKKVDGAFKGLATYFWQSENKLLHRDIVQEMDGNRLMARISLFASPLTKEDSLFSGYQRAADATDSYLSLIDTYKINDPRMAQVLYLGGLTHYTLGHNEHALELLQRLRKEFPDYKRDLYISDRYLPDPRFAQPTAPGVSKLIFFLRLQTAPEASKDTFAALQQLSGDALTTLKLQKEFADWMANRPSIHDRRDFSESFFGSQPDQVRASALPFTMSRVEATWNPLFEKSLKQIGALKMRQFLRGLNAPDAPLAQLAAARLPAVDTLVIKNYMAAAQRLMKAKNFDGARAQYKRIIAEYPGTPGALQAEAQFPKITRLAVAFYKAEGKKYFQPANKIGVPQTKSRQYFEKLLKEDPNSDFALYYHSRALGTENKIPQAIKQLQTFDRKFPDSPLRSAALYLQGFLLAGLKPPNYQRAVAIMDRVARDFPQSDEAPEALFHAGVYLAWQSRFPEAIKRLNQVEKYPKSIRHKWAKPFAERLQQKIKDGTQWP